uniref:Uncharacterized protein n=1 Tax=Rhizophora mucronata TaxID=61149 RepID=A0A2P2QLV0_RHIMU
MGAGRCSSLPCPNTCSCCVPFCKINLHESRVSMLLDELTLCPLPVELGGEWWRACGGVFKP